MPFLKLYLFGPPRIERDGESIKLSNRKATALLAYIATTGRSHSRDSLVNLLWPHNDFPSGRNLLRVTLHSLGKTLEMEWSVADRQTIALNPSSDLWVDVVRFHNLLEECRSHGHSSSEVCPECLIPLSEAVKLYQDNFLTGFTLNDSANFDDWQISQAQSTHSDMTSALERLVRYLGKEKEFEKTIGYALRWLEMDTTNEDAHYHLIEAYARSGRRTAALEQYEKCLSLLKEKLGVDPQESTVQLYQKIKKNELVAELPQRKILDIPSNNLPIQLTSFIGREREIAEIIGLLKNTRLMTLTGVGGCGKTRLGLQVASNLVEDYSDGAWLVELASLSDPTLVAQKVASVLDVEEQRGRFSNDTLTNYLRSKQMLLVFDNCEHIIEACAALAESLLQACPNLKILATSREALGIAGETLWNVSPLSTPDLRQKPSFQTSDLSLYESISLFTERASNAQPTFTVTENNSSTVAQICSRLDGIPLAIELAAARVKALSVDQIAERLEDRFGLLRGGSRTALPRQQTLEATMDWSHNLLSEGERTLFRRLSAFAGGFTLRAAEAVGNGGYDLEIDVLDGIISLVDQSLLRGEEDPPGQVVSSSKEASFKKEVGEPRFTMLETVREYGMERLRESGKEDDIRRLHAHYFMARAEEAEMALRGPEQVAWVRRLEIEGDNLREAFEWSLESGEVEVGLRLAGALRFLWLMSSYHTEVRGWIEKGLSQSRGVSASVRVKALIGLAGALAAVQGDYGRVVELCEESLALAQELGSKEDIAWSLGFLGMAKLSSGDGSEGIRLLEESIAKARELEDKWSTASLLLIPEYIFLNMGNYGRARELLEESLAMFREAGDNFNIANSLKLLGTAMFYEGDYDRSRDLLEESLDLYREARNTWNSADSLIHLGRVALQQGDYDRALEFLEEPSALARKLEDSFILATSMRISGRVAHAQSKEQQALALYQESITISQELKDHGGVVGCLEGLTEVIGKGGQPEIAARLYGAAENWRETNNTPLHPSFRADYDRSVDAIRSQLEKEAFAAAWAAGRALTLEEATKEALTIVVEIPKKTSKES